jgi:N-acetylglucosaminyldiphosphoundecaprenol N-acetyl-beta-D-mannosaminyltransferase
MGFEWLWRIRKNPSLVGRYFRDVLTVGTKILFFTLPALLFAKLLIGLPGRNVGEFRYALSPPDERTNDNSMRVSIQGRVGDSEVDRLRSEFKAILGDTSDIDLELVETRIESEEFYGLLVLLNRECMRSGQRLKVRLSDLHVKLNFKARELQDLVTTPL